MELQVKYAADNNRSTRLLIKGLITGILILVMLIPTLFVSELVKEREERQKQVVQEVSGKWAAAQTVAGPYISVPYIETYEGGDGKPVTVRKNLVLLPENLAVSGRLLPEERHRSIYHVLLYRSLLQLNGTFNIRLPEEIPAANVDFAKARICIGISDFKGIEEKISIRFNNSDMVMTPGLPDKALADFGLSAPISLDATGITQPIAFAASLKLKGSEQLHFLPLAANSSFSLASGWPSPSFDGNTLPTTNAVTDSGFTANWRFNQANLPFTTAIQDESIKEKIAGFGVSMLQPADQYGKTMRSVKYAILFIGLTFALFFIVELMQQKPVHPVQYVLVGIALIIFYTLLLSISEFIAFDIAYLIAAVATVSLITLYAKGHFQSWKTASVFAAVLGVLYGFIFILIRLEDTALLVGSIGLFIVLALVMYASRKINWYGHQPKTLVQ